MVIFLKIYIFFEVKKRINFLIFNMHLDILPRSHATHYVALVH